MRQDEKPPVSMKNRDRLKPIEQGPSWGLGQFRHQHLVHHNSRRKSRMVARWGGHRDYDIPLRRLPLILLAVAANAIMLGETLSLMAWMAGPHPETANILWRVGLVWGGLSCVGFLMLMIHLVTRRHISWFFQCVPILGAGVIAGIALWTGVWGQ